MGYGLDVGSVVFVLPPWLGYHCSAFTTTQSRREFSVVLCRMVLKEYGFHNKEANEGWKKRYGVEEAV